MKTSLHPQDRNPRSLANVHFRNVLSSKTQFKNSVRQPQFEHLEKRQLLTADAWSVFSYFDTNGDSRLNALDSLLVANASNMPEAKQDLKFDLNRDRVVDKFDFEATVTAVITAKKYKLPGDGRPEGEYGGPPDPTWDLPFLDAVNYTSFDISADPYTRDAAGLKTFPTEDPHSGGSVGGRSSYNRYYQWEDKNGDGFIIHALDEVSLPVAIVANTKANVRSMFSAADPNKTYPPLLWARAYNPITPLNVHVSSQPSVLVGLDPADSHYHFDYLATSNFYDKVAHFTSVNIRFDVDLVDGTGVFDWQQIGQSDNHVYVTLDSPYAASIDNNGSLMPYYHTVLHIGSHYAAGETTADRVVEKVWDYFKGLQVKNQDVTQFNGVHQVMDVGKPLYYYRFSAIAGCKAATTTALLVDQVHHINENESEIVQCGQCGAFTRLFLAVLGTQGVKLPAVPGGMPVRLNEGVATSPLPHLFLTPTTLYEQPANMYIKEYSGTVVDNFIYNPILGDQLNGQNEANPKESIFANHQFVSLIVAGEEHWFDPSYGFKYIGVDDYSRRNNFEAEALKGIGIVDAAGVTGIYLDKPDTVVTNKSRQTYLETPANGHAD